MLLTYLIVLPSIILHAFVAAKTSQLMTTKADRRIKQTDSSETNTDLICPRCQEERCRPSRKQRLNCRGGYTLDVCNCCPTCAKLEGDLCGGDYQMFGKCDRGMVCQPNSVDANRYGVYKNPVGRCERVIGTSLLQADQPKGLHCKPLCTPEYCTKNPKAICSAVENAETSQPCQGDCQHTSCKACRRLSNRPDCPKCSNDDFSCMRNFANCIKKHLCKRTKGLPCKRVESSKYDGYFQCIVPECL
ncbi:cysteine-rich motor neuron 1 protein-like [Lineus longissimus]|uniref:cysteine-rich motor neuron 1 protein-like n=1 Tax=Lineus longissimus TaxID=88925 RepID=UPI00315CC1DD